MSEGISGINSAGLENFGPQTQKTKNIVGKDDFLKLLTYQLRAQNPLKPYDNQEFAAQLAQFSQLEQLTDIRTLLEEQMQMNMLLTQTISNTALPGLLGKYANAITDKLSFDGDNPVKLGYSINANAQSGNLIIRDESGKVIRTIQLDGMDLKQGEHWINWDGKDSEGNIVSSGKYTFSVEMRDSSGGSFTGKTYITGKIEAVRFKSEGTLLVIAGMEIPLSEITDIRTEG